MGKIPKNKIGSRILSCQNKRELDTFLVQVIEQYPELIFSYGELKRNYSLWRSDIDGYKVSPTNEEISRPKLTPWYSEEEQFIFGQKNLPSKTSTGSPSLFFGSNEPQIKKEDQPKDPKVITLFEKRRQARQSHKEITNP